MSTSQNGYSANDRSVIASYTVPGTTLKVALRKGDVSVVLLDFLTRYHREVENLYNVPQDLWGYAERKIRGSSTTLSNHASGTAVDVRATAHPLGRTGTFDLLKRNALRNLLNSYDGILRWGGDYTGRKDEMHIEINAGIARVHQVANRIRSNQGIPVQVAAPAAPAPVTVLPVQPPGLVSRKPDRLPELQVGQESGWVVLIQRIVGVKADGKFGPRTRDALRAWQSRVGARPDGIVGNESWAAAVTCNGLLREGSRGDSVEVLQNFLGFRPGSGLDGVFGPATKSRLIEVQRWGGVATDGIAGNDVRKVLERA